MIVNTDQDYNSVAGIFGLADTCMHCIILFSTAKILRKKGKHTLKITYFLDLKLQRTVAFQWLLKEFAIGAKILWIYPWRAVALLRK